MGKPKKSIGKWSHEEEALVAAGAPIELVVERTGRTRSAVQCKRSELNQRYGEKIREKSYMRFLNEERAARREMKKEEKRKSITIAEIRAKRKEFQRVEPEVLNPLIDEEIKKRIPYIPSEALDETPSELQKALKSPPPVETKTWKEVAPGAGYICVENISPAPNPDELFFDINGTQVRVSAGTKKVDVLPYGLIIEF